MKNLALILSLAWATVGSAIAGSVTLSTATGSRFTTSAGAALPAGAIARIGSFNLSDAALASTSDYALLNAAFKPLAEGFASSGTTSQTNGAGTHLCVNGFPSTGHIFGTVSGISSSYLATGTQLYVWVFDASTASSASQWGIFKASTWQVPPELGAQTLATSGTVTALQGSIASGQLRLATPVSTFGNWDMKHFAGNAPASVTAFDADPDNDGLHNLAEYAWQLNPSTRSTGRTTLVSGVGGATFTFKTPKHLPDVAVTAECSSDLQTWSTATSSITASDEDFDTRTSTVAPGDARCFWRVRFSAVP